MENVHSWDLVSYYVVIVIPVSRVCESAIVVMIRGPLDNGANVMPNPPFQGVASIS